VSDGFCHLTRSSCAILIAAMWAGDSDVTTPWWLCQLPRVHAYKPSRAFGSSPSVNGHALLD
jgi:hypothetical protein